MVFLKINYRASNHVFLVAIKSIVILYKVMNHLSHKILNFHSDLLKNTQLGRLCGSKILFDKRYAILRILGKGAFGVIFLARNVTLPGHPLCVIKQLYPQVSSLRGLQKAKQRFEKEAKTLGSVGKSLSNSHAFRLL